MVALALHRQTSIKRQESTEEIEETDRRLEQSHAQRQTAELELKRVQEESKAIQDEMTCEKRKSEQMDEEIKERRKVIEENTETMETDKKEGKQRRIFLKKISAGSGILSTIGTVTAATATVLFPPAGVIVAGIFKMLAKRLI